MDGVIDFYCAPTHGERAIHLDLEYARGARYARQCLGTKSRIEYAAGVNAGASFGIVSPPSAVKSPIGGATASGTTRDAAAPPTTRQLLGVGRSGARTDGRNGQCAGVGDSHPPFDALSKTHCRKPVCAVGLQTGFLFFSRRARTIQQRARAG